MGLCVLYPEIAKDKGPLCQCPGLPFEKVSLVTILFPFFF